MLERINEYYGDMISQLSVEVITTENRESKLKPRREYSLKTGQKLSLVKIYDLFDIPGLDLRDLDYQPLFFEGSELSSSAGLRNIESSITDIETILKEADCANQDEILPEIKLARIKNYTRNLSKMRNRMAWTKGYLKELGEESFNETKIGQMLSSIKTKEQQMVQSISENDFLLLRLEAAEGFFPARNEPEESYSRGSRSAVNKNLKLAREGVMAEKGLSLFGFDLLSDSHSRPKEALEIFAEESLLGFYVSLSGAIFWDGAKAGGILPTLVLYNLEVAFQEDKHDYFGRNCGERLIDYVHIEDPLEEETARTAFSFWARSDMEYDSPHYSLEKALEAAEQL